MKCVLVICGLLLLAGCAVDESVIRSEESVEGHWRLVEKELIDATPTPETLKTWKKRIPIFILASRRRLAELKGEEFDMKTNLAELGIKKKGEK